MQIGVSTAQVEGSQWWGMDEGMEHGAHKAGVAQIDQTPEASRQPVAGTSLLQPSRSCLLAVHSPICWQKRDISY